jgi:hypothetical protein
MILASFKRSLDDEDQAPSANEGAEVTPPGERLGRQLAERMNGDGCVTERFDLHEEYAWSWLATVGGARYYVMLIPFYEGVEGQWLISADSGLVVFGRRAYREAEARLRSMLAAILTATEGVSDIGWPAKL